MKTKILLAFVLVTLMISCSTEFSDEPYLVGAPETFDALMDQGWSAFETENYELAVESFAAAAERKATLPEVYLGRGWSNIRNLSLEAGRDDLGSAIAFAFLDTLNEQQIILDSKSGLAGIALIEGNYEQAIAYVDDILDSHSSYKFEHDSLKVNSTSMKRIRATASYYVGGYADAFQEVLDLGIIMENVILESPISGDVSAFAVVDSGMSLPDGGVLSANSLKVTALSHGLEANDFIVLDGLDDGGVATLTDVVENYTKASGWKIRTILDGDNFILTTIDSATAANLGSIGLSEAKFYEGTGVAMESDDSGLDGVHKIGIYGERQLVQVNSVTALIDDGATYRMHSIDEGGTEFEIFRNPVFDVNQRVAVEYYHTDDFGLFLSELIELVSNVQ